MQRIVHFGQRSLGIEKFGWLCRGNRAKREIENRVIHSLLLPWNWQECHNLDKASLDGRASAGPICRPNFLAPNALLPQFRSGIGRMAIPPEKFQQSEDFSFKCLQIFKDLNSFPIQLIAQSTQLSSHRTITENHNVVLQTVQNVLQIVQIFVNVPCESEKNNKLITLPASDLSHLSRPMSSRAVTNTGAWIDVLIGF